MIDLISFGLGHFQQAEFFCNAIGVLQACANPSKFDGLERVGAQPQDIDESVKDYPRNFARDIAA